MDTFFHINYFFSSADLISSSVDVEVELGGGTPFVGDLYNNISSTLSPTKISFRTGY
jgi:hypothetical protein